MVGAIIISEQMASAENMPFPSRIASPRRPWAAVEALGKAPIIRLAEELKKRVCDIVSVIENDLPDSHQARSTIADLSTDRFASYKREGCATVLIVRCGAYVELDAEEMLRFHLEQGSGITRAVTDERPLDVWMADPSGLSEQGPILPALLSASSAMYPSQGYVNDLRTPQDFRRLVLDSFHAVCGLRPQGSEIRPGVWICEGAQIERSARIVAPAFIGSGARISEECLITRASNVESNSHVDFGTVVEDSSILSNSYLGIGLDLSHSIVDGCNLLNLQHNVALEITDPVVMRQNPVRGGNRHSWAAGVDSGQMALSSAE